MERRNKNTLEAIDREVDIEENIVTVSWIMSFVQFSISFDDTSCNYDSLLEPQVEEQIRWNERDFFYKFVAQLFKLHLLERYLKSNYGCCCAQWYLILLKFILHHERGEIRREKPFLLKMHRITFLMDAHGCI